MTPERLLEIGEFARNAEATWLVQAIGELTHALRNAQHAAQSMVQLAKRRKELADVQKAQLAVAVTALQHIARETIDEPRYKAARSRRNIAISALRELGVQFE